MPKKLIVTTGSAVDGAHVNEYLGIVRGIAVRVPTPNQSLQALGNVLGGNWQGGAEMLEGLCETTRAKAYDRMVEHAHELGADAVIAMRFTATDAGSQCAEILAYGTAVKLKFPEVLPADSG